MALMSAFEGCSGEKHFDERIKAIIECVRASSPTGKAVLDASINECKTQYVFAKGSAGAFGSYSSDLNAVVLNPLYTDEDLCSTIVHEARHSLQKRFKDGNLKSLILMSRTQEADASAHGCATAYEMRKNRPAVWKAFKTRSPRMASAYERTVSAGTKEALSEAFKAWFDNRSYVNRYDEDSIVKGQALKKIAPKREVSAKNLLSAVCARSEFGVYVEPSFLNTDRALTITRGTAFNLRMAGFSLKDASIYDFKIPRLIQKGVRAIKKDSFAAKAAAFLAPRGDER